MTERTYSKFYVSLIYLVLAVSTFIAYEPMRHNDFIGFDDPAYVTNNPHVKGGVTRGSIVWAFTTSHSGNWHSLTWLSHMLDCQLFGLNALGHHLTSLLFHIANTLLLFLVLKKMTGAVWPSAFVAAAFALHPLRVESVAWVAERKDVLSGFFWMLTMIAYARYAERPGRRRYLLIVLAFCLGLLSKPMLVTLPFVLLLLDYWPLRRFQHVGEDVNRRSHESANTHFQWPVFYRLVREKIPLFIISVISSVITFLVQRSWGAVVPIELIPATARITNVFISYIKYIGKMFWPSRLAVFYLYSSEMIPVWQAVISVLLLLTISICVIRLVRKHKYLTVGWLWYLGTLVPVIGLVHVGSQAIADRYTYLPSIGIFVMVAWGIAELGAKWRFQKMWLGISMGLVLAILLICTRMQVRYWQDSFTLYEHAVEATKNNFRMHTSYGVFLKQREEFDKAVVQFREALRINPRYSKAHHHLGKVLFKQGNFDEAIRCFKAVLLIEDVNLPEVYGDIGLAYANLRENSLAVTNLTKSIELDPNSADSLNNLAWVLATTGDTKLRNPTDALKYAQRACELADPNQLTYWDTLAVAYAAAGNFPEAVKTAEKAIKLAEAADEKDLAKEIQERLYLYKSDQPYREE